MVYSSLVGLRAIHWKMFFLELQTAFHVASVCGYICIDNVYFPLQEILHQRFMAISEPWLAEQQIGSDFKSRDFLSCLWTLQKKTLPSTHGHKKPCEGFFHFFKSPSFVSFSARSINRKKRFDYSHPAALRVISISKFSTVIILIHYL